MNSHSFQDDIRPLIEEYQQRSRCNEPYNQRPEPPRTLSDPRSEEPSLSDIPTFPEDIPLPTLNESSNSSIPHTVPIHDRMTSSLSSFDKNESLDFHTAPTNQHNRTDEPVKTNLSLPTLLWGRKSILLTSTKSLRPPHPTSFPTILL